MTAFSRHCLVMLKELPFQFGNLRFQKSQNKLQEEKITLVSEWNQSRQPEAIAWLAPLPLTPRRPGLCSG